MPAYLDRYRQGECVSVWSELTAMGGQIREKPLYDDVLAVVQETMTRARSNVELLVQRLTTLEYKFADLKRIFVPAKKKSKRLLNDVEKKGGTLPLSLRVWCEVVGDVNFMGSHPKLSTYVQSPGAGEFAQNFLSLFAMHGGSAGGKGDAVHKGMETIRRLQEELTQSVKTGKPRSTDMNAALQASKELLTGAQKAVVEKGPDVDSDPLVVEPYFPDKDDMDEIDPHECQPEMDDGTFVVMIAPDLIQKTNHSGGDPYTIRYPNPAIDARLDGGVEYGTFIQYLRTCFQWGGFPGLRSSAKPPREELEYLTKDLTPV